MTARRWTYRLARFSVFVALAALVVAASRPAAADERPKLDTSVKLIPADAAFYSSMLRIGEQFQAIKHSNAWAKISEMPFVRSWIMMYQMQEQFPGSMPARVAGDTQQPQEPRHRRVAQANGLGRGFRLRRSVVRRFRAAVPDRQHGAELRVDEGANQRSSAKAATRSRSQVGSGALGLGGETPT